MSTTDTTTDLGPLAGAPELEAAQAAMSAAHDVLFDALRELHAGDRTEAAVLADAALVAAMDATFDAATRVHAAWDTGTDPEATELCARCGDNGEVPGITGMSAPRPCPDCR